MRDIIKFKEGYKFQLEEDYSYQTGITPEIVGGNDFVQIGYRGLLTIKRGYAWDGASGPAINTLNFRRGSLVHDALYQLIRMGNLTEDHRDEADLILKHIILEDGMWSIRAWWVYQAVHNFGGAYMRIVEDKVLTAP